MKENNYTLQYRVDDDLSNPYCIEFETNDYEMYLYLRNLISREIEREERRQIEGK